MSQILLYQSEDGRTKLDVRLENQTLWLNQKQLTELFGKAKGTISEHIEHIFEDGELDRRHALVQWQPRGRTLSPAALAMIGNLSGVLSNSPRQVAAWPWQCKTSGNNEQFRFQWQTL